MRCLLCTNKTSKVSDSIYTKEPDKSIGQDRLEKDKHRSFKNRGAHEALVGRFRLCLLRDALNAALALS